MTHLPLSRAIEGRVACVAPTPRMTLLNRFLGVWRQRQQLDRLPDHMRRDLGLSDRDIAQEVARPIWDVPATWRV